MPKFHLNARVTVSATLAIEADTLADAIKKAENLPVMHSSEAHFLEGDEVWVVEEMDGSPREIHEDDDRVL
ncbi:hypothetical protein M3914_003153 [Vibrio metschnikovii]|nr:hypothetical protein [Vibrio metschnikovii]